MVETEKLDELYKTMLDNSLFTRKWQKTNTPPVGGSRRNLTVIARGKRTMVEDFLIAEQQSEFEAVCAKVPELVPKDLWERLNTKREQYMKEYPRHLTL